MKNILKNNKAITLIVLVITIVVLIILVAVAINLSVGENGLITRAKYAKELYLTKANEEATSLASFDDIVERLTVALNGGRGEITSEEVSNLINQAVEAKMSSYAKSSDLDSYAKSSDLSDYALKSEVKNDEADNYSTTPKIVGTWTDGKPIWQRTYLNQTVPNISNHQQAGMIDLTDCNINKFISATGTITDGTLQLIFNNFYGSNWYTTACYKISSKELWVNVAGYAGWSADVTIQYTKN